MALRAHPHPAPIAAPVPDPGILRGIRQASQATDIDFGYLVAQAQQESGFQPHAAAKSSSARGLYQFIDTTWLEMMRRYGGRYGAGAYAAQITLDDNGRPTVANPHMRRQILGLRDDPSLSAALAAEYARSNKEDLEQALRRPINNTDLYIAHFLGSGGAASFLKNLQRNAAAPAANLFPEAAAANRSVFYNRRTGTARSVADIYRIFASKIEKHSNDFAVAMEGASAASATAAAMPLTRSRGPMPLRMSPTLVAMYNVIAATAMKTLGGSELTLKKEAGGGVSVAPASAPAAANPRPRHTAHHRGRHVA
ncbi:MAG TPA: transglycosylase SLT domain-containing protein [Stellaceae bacterium]|nr:transglycosylase SLT domain-containing protein [Stellaceae bacterium]